MIATAAIAWALLTSGIGVAVYVVMRRQIRALADKLAEAHTEQRRLRSWATHWQQQATALAGFLARSQSGYSRRGKRARSIQIAQDRARVMETARRMEAGR